MKLDVKSIFGRLVRYYDRLLALATMIALLVSLVFLVVRVGGIPAEKALFEGQIRSLTPRHEQASPVDKSTFESALHDLGSPFQFAAWSNALTVPELRVWCVDCRRPIPFHSTNCPTCLAAQPGMETNKVSVDEDEDGMLNAWEEQYGLNPRDADDAGWDLDGDGFKNREEHDFGTNPADPNEFPPVIAKLKVLGITAQPFMLRFMGVSRLGDKQIFQLNLRQGGQTYWRSLDEEVEGFVLSGFEPRMVKEEKDGRATEVDRSILTLKRGEKVIQLEKGQPVPIHEYEARLLFQVDRTEPVVRINSELVLKGTKFVVKSIDTKEQRVLIMNDTTGKETWIGR